MKSFLSKYKKIKTFKNSINNFSFSLNTILFFGLITSYVSNSTLEEVQTSLKEISYSYYMRGKYIQYNQAKAAWFSPEEATEQNNNFLVCSAFTTNVYRELLNITIPTSTGHLLEYSRNNIGNPEVIAYSYINENNIPEMKIYSPNKEKKYEVVNPSIKNIIDLIQIGDILTYSGHTKLIYDIEKDNNGKIIDGIILQSSGTISIVKTKIGKETLTINGNSIPFNQYILCFNNKLNSGFEEGLEEGTVGLTRLSTFSHWVNIDNIEKR